jgi:hypothetical protein
MKKELLLKNVYLKAKLSLKLIVNMLKSSINSIRIIKSFAKYFLCLLTYCAFSQSAEKQVIRVEKMEYVYYPYIAASINGFNSSSNSRVILPTDSAIAEKMKQSILSAINNRWNAVILNPRFEMTEIDHLFKTGKFKTKLKNKISGSWHLFFQVYDNGPYQITDEKKKLFSNVFDSYPAFESLDYAPYYMRFKALIIDGSNGSEIFSNEMMVEMQRSSVPDDQILLRKVPALTDSFLQAFDDAVQKFFSSTPQNELKLEVTPACLFLDVDKNFAEAKKLNFVTKNDSVVEQLQLKQEWIIQKTRTQKTKRVNHFGDNLFNSSLTALTGLGTDKIRAMGYLTKFGFIDTRENAHYFCEIPFIEETREEKEREVTRDSNGNKSYENYLNGESNTIRFVDPDKICYLIREKDTIGSFKVKIIDSVTPTKHFSQCWDGKNESTISTIPEIWNNPSSNQNRQSTPYILEGELYKIPFVVEKSKAGNQIDIEINGKEITTLKTYNNLPVLGLLYSTPIDEKVFTVLMMLSTLPFNSIF